MTSYFLPDINVWLALTVARHSRHRLALNWLAELESASLHFCRLTQLGLLRLLTTRPVMEADLLSQSGAWEAYRTWFKDPRVAFHPEPHAPELEDRLRRFSMAPRSSPKLWSDAYLAAFASVAGLTLVTFDRAIAALVPHEAVVLG